MAVHRRDRFELVATGDAMITRELGPYAGTADRFDGLIDRVRGADAAVTNLEVLVHDYEADAGVYPTRSLGTFMRAPPAVLDELEWMGFDLFTTATNHAFDYAYGGLERTMAALEARGLRYAGIGRNLYEARRPAYLETPGGRVGLLSTCTTINPGSEATPQSAAMHGSPGINPLRRDRVYRVLPDQLEQLRAISETLNIEEIKREWLERGIYGGHDWLKEEFFHFMDMKMQATEDPDEVGIHDVLDEDDRAGVLEWVVEADAAADWVVVGIHCHESPLGYHNKPTVPGFLREFAHACVDAGADAVVGHGPHILRGIEVYEGAPICYSLGNFVDQRESIERLPPAQYARHGLEDPTKVSSVFDSRSLDEKGELKADFADPWWWRSVLPSMHFAGGELEAIELRPLTLQGEAGRPGRGTPVLADGDEAAAVLDRLVDLSAPFDTTIEVDGDVGHVVV